MIFVTVGTQLPFDRLIQAVDEIAPLLGDEEIIAQTKGGEYVAKNIKCYEYIERERYMELFKSARLVVSHAGTGSILTAMKFHKNIIIMPRLASLREHRNNHQVHTANALKEHDNIKIVNRIDELRSILTENVCSVCKRRHVDGRLKSLTKSIERFLLKEGKDSNQ